jgi:hypothetical protein
VIEEDESRARWQKEGSWQAGASIR